ncbi:MULTISPECIES: LuxR C-terminal-related transcriptional regulator [unclassified Cryobacterium]|uniref:LuxR C-terminal-related transcriptional regulator n=1 Tax=unclassified Cryobacterium TaxID=2649013 RepID=UPI001447D4D4|nr:MULTISPECIES: LuxR C-terminal-related transcriptional regulator [unclassified Cryobacterium]
MAQTRRIPPHAVDRPELRHQLDTGLAAPLTLLVAPAGAGKTVLLSQWVPTRPELAVAWLDVTSADDDSVHFARRIVHALGALDSRLSEIVPLGEPGGGLGAAMVEALGTALGHVSREVVVILDDLHNLTNRSTVEDLWALADRLPPNAHLVFSSRADLRLAWSRHRLQHGLVELRQAQLAFDERDTGAVLTKITGRPVDEITAVSVMRHTEGWAAGIQLAGLTLRFHADPEVLVDTLAETDRLIVDFLSQEVLDAQTPSRRRALLALSVLDEMSAGLVQALTDVTDGAALLRDLEQESMFVVPLPGRRDWYRFHHLFRDLLRYRLRATDAQAETRLRQAAADWYLAADDPASAIECFLRGRMWPVALDLIFQHGRAVWERGGFATIARWLSIVPREVRLARPGAEALYGILASMTGRAAEGEDIFRALLSDSRTGDGYRLVVSTYVAGVVQFRPHPEIYLADALSTIELLDAQPDTPIPDLLQLTDRDQLAALAAVSAGRAYLFMNQLEQSREWLERGLASMGGRYGLHRVHGLGSLALAEAWSGCLRAATEHADEALDLARELSLLSQPAPGDAYLARAFVAIQKGEPQSGAIALHEGSLRAAADQRNPLLWLAHLGSKLTDPLGTDPSAIQPTGTPPPIVRQSLLALSHRLARFDGEARPIEPQGEWSGLAFEEIAAALEGGDVRAARQRLADIPFHPDPRAPVPATEHRILEGWLHSLEGRGGRAREDLSVALDVAEPEWLVHPFLRAGPVVSHIIDAIPGLPNRFRRTIVQSSENVGRRRSGDLIEPLTSRELEILDYLPTRLTNAEVAARCYVSVNTIKTHMAHIYRKLEVPDRSAAITRAVELGLIETSDPYSLY